MVTRASLLVTSASVLVARSHYSNNGIAASNKCIDISSKKLLVTRGIAASNKCIVISSKKLLVTRASLLVTSASLFVARSY